MCVPWVCSWIRVVRVSEAVRGQLDDIADGRVKTSYDIMEGKWQISAEVIRLLIELKTLFGCRLSRVVLLRAGRWLRSSGVVWRCC